MTDTPQGESRLHVYAVAANTATVFGTGKAEDLPLKGMLDLGTCTECGVACQSWNYRGHLPARTPAHDHTEVTHLAASGKGSVFRAVLRSRVARHGSRGRGRHARTSRYSIAPSEPSAGIFQDRPASAPISPSQWRPGSLVD